MTDCRGRREVRLRRHAAGSREVWDPRISPALKTTYDYDADGRVIELTPPGELPWKFAYGTGGANVDESAPATWSTGAPAGC